MTHPLLPDVVVNGEAIPQSAIAAEAQNQNAPADKPGLAWRKAARALAIRSLMLQEAKRRGLSPVPRRLGERRRETHEEALIRGLLDEALLKSKPTEEAVRAIYEANPSKFRAPTIYEPAHILIAAPPDDEAAREVARTLAKSLLSVLRNDADAFGRLAREVSACCSCASGGRLGQIMAGDTVPEFEAALVRLSPGELSSEPVETAYGVHIIRLDARADGEVLPFETVKESILEALEKTAWAGAGKRLVRELIEAATVSGVDFELAA